MGAINLVKLCVGIGSLDDYRALSEQRWTERTTAGIDPPLFHVTRMVPRRREELVGQSLYWVIAGQIQCRQRLLDIVPFEDEEGIRRCRLVLDRSIVATHWKRKKAFQGWRYLTPRAAPEDLPEGQQGIPEKLRRELDELGLL